VRSKGAGPNRRQAGGSGRAADKDPLRLSWLGPSFLCERIMLARGPQAAAHTSATIVVVCRSFGVAFQAFTFAYLANRLPISDMGALSSIYAFWTLVRMLGPFGLDQIATRDIAAANARNDPTYANALSNFTSSLVTKISFLVSVVVAGGLLALHAHGGYQVSPVSIIAAACGVPAYAFMGLLSGQLCGFKRYVSSQLVDSFGLQIGSAALLVLIDFFWRLDLEYALVAQAFTASLVAVAYGLVRMQCGFDFSARLLAEQRKEVCGHAFQIWQTLLVVGSAFRLPTYISLFILGPATTAVLETATRFGTLPTIFTASVQNTFSPHLSGSYAQADIKQLQELFTIASWFAFIPSMSFAIAFALVGRWFVAALFPPEYARAWAPLLLLAIASTVNAGVGLSSAVFLMTGRSTIVRRYAIFQIVACGVLGCVFAKLFGLLGISVAVLIGVIIRDVGLACRLSTELGICTPANASGFKQFVRAIFPAQPIARRVSVSTDEPGK
jgi:O-antigen/teichoic acid export membrane protein